jgi:hypothetical protein
VHHHCPLQTRLPKDAGLLYLAHQALDQGGSKQGLPNANACPWSSLATSKSAHPGTLHASAGQRIRGKKHATAAEMKSTTRLEGDDGP